MSGADSVKIPALHPLPLLTPVWAKAHVWPVEPKDPSLDPTRQSIAPAAEFVPHPQPVMQFEP